MKIKLNDPVVRSFQVAKVFRGNTDKVNAIDFSSNGEHFISCGEDDQIVIFDCEKGIQTRTVNSKKYGVDLIHFTHAYSTAIHSSTKVDHKIRYLSLHDNKYLRYFPGHTKKVTSLCMSPIDDTFLSGSLDKTVRLWDLRSPNGLGLMHLPGRPVIAYDPEGLIFAAGINSETIKLYDLRSFRNGPFLTVKFKPEKECDWTGLKFSRNGKNILISTNGSIIRLIDAFDGTPFLTFTGYPINKGIPIEASFSPDSQFIFSGSTDGRVHVWNAVTGYKVCVLNGNHPGPVQCVQFNPKYMMLASACTDIAFWQAIPVEVFYIAGNMGYMEGNLSGMDYSYGGASTHYPLWKPPSGYFPRGEAPPPYEEAVAISQAEALSAQCTVSVATTTHRSLPVGINPVDISNDVVRRGQLAQPQQQHSSQTAAAQMQPQQAQHHQQSITQSTTNLINININSGGNLTTIATGESHQPPYSCITAVNQPCSTQTPSNCSSALSSLGDVAAVAAAANNARLHLPNNSICVQTTAAPISNSAAIHNAQHQQHYQQAQQHIQFQQRTQQQQQQLHLHQQQQQQQQQQHQQSQSLQQTNCIQITECTYKNCHLNSSNRRIQKQHPTQEMIHYVSNASTGVTFQAITNERSDADAMANKCEQLTSPQYSTAECNGRIQEISTITSSESVAAQTSSLKTANKTPSSSRRYHRTIPRYFAVVDPLGQTTQQIPKPISSSAASSKSSSTNNGSINNSINNNSKKPTCQCPVQHVPMSYMGTNQINNSQTNNVFLSALSTKLVSNRSSFGTKCMPPGTPTASSKLANQNSPHELTSNSNGAGTMKRGSTSSSNSQNHQSNLYCQHDAKIATISKQVGDLKTETPTFETHTILQSYGGGGGGGDDKVHSSHKGKINSGKITSSPKLLPESTSLYSTGNLNTVPLNYPEANPALPPKMYKSQTNLKSPGASAAAQLLLQKSPHHGEAVNQIPTISHQKSQFTKSLPRKEDKNTPPALTLPISGQLSTEKSQSLGKINSSTFYPLQNNHVTYTLPKHTSGKMSLNSTIASVVSKVPSVISIPVSDESNTSRMKSQPQSPNHKVAATSQANKCTTLPKTLRSAAKKIEASTTTTATTPATPSSSCSNPKPLDSEKPLPVCTTSKNCLNPKEHFLPNDTSLDDDYLSECENCKIAHSSKYYLDEEIADSPQETMTLQRKMDDKEEQEQAYYRISHTLPTNPKKNPTIKNNSREPWFSTIPASSSSEEEINE